MGLTTKGRTLRCCTVNPGPSSLVKQNARPTRPVMDSGDSLILVISPPPLFLSLQPAPPVLTSQKTTAVS